MAPTELLSEQHFRGFNQWFEPLGVKVLWLTGQIKGKARREALAAVEEGEVDIVVGTHALFQDHVSFASLGLVLVDEQHRFGVNQRLSLTRRGKMTSPPPADHDRHPHTKNTVDGGVRGLGLLGD